MISLDLVNDASVVSNNPTPRTPLQVMRKDDWRYEEAPALDHTFITKYLQPEEGRTTTRKQPLVKVLSERNLKVCNSGGKHSCRTPKLIKKVADKENI